MKLGDFAVNWFDVFVMVVIGLGLYRGRSRGMSCELLDVLKWLVIVVLAALLYRPTGQFIAGYTGVKPLWGYVLAYLSVLLAVRLFFGWLKRMVGEKLVGSDVFGGGEYYLGMIAGAVRFTCVLLVLMALLNAKYISAEQLAAEARAQRQNFEDISFPTLGTIQQTVFVGSASGRAVRQYLGHELIVTTPKECSSPASDTMAHQRERAVSEVLGERH